MACCRLMVAQKRKVEQPEGRVGRSKTHMKTRMVVEPAASSLLMDCWLHLDMTFPSARLRPHSQFHIFSESL